MITVIIHGQSHKGSTYHIARMLAEKIGFDIIEFFLPRDFGEFCLGCTRCFMESEDKCPHYEKLAPIVDALDRADVIILASPVYVYHVTGSMKAFLDHLGFRWMVHRPSESMFSKQGVCISTAAGGGTKSTNKDLADSLFQWGVGKIYKYGCNVRATKWDTVSEKKKRDIERKTTSLAKTIRDSAGHITPDPKTKGLFSIMRAVGGLSSTDKLYWKKEGMDGEGAPLEITGMKTGKNDYILIGVILLAALLIYGGYRLANMGSGGTLLITVNGKEYSRLSLAEEGIFLIREGEAIRKLSSAEVPPDINDKKYNILTIKGGSASVVDAGCPDLLCVHQKDISLKGEQIVCLPNKVVVSVIDGEESPVDTVTN